MGCFFFVKENVFLFPGLLAGEAPAPAPAPAARTAALDGIRCRAVEDRPVPSLPRAQSSCSLMPFGFRSPACGNNVLLSLFIAHFSFLTRFIIIFKACVAQSKSSTSPLDTGQPRVGLGNPPCFISYCK